MLATSNRPSPLTSTCRMGRYRLAEKLGEGGTGVVYATRDGDGRPLAIKVARSRSNACVGAIRRETSALRSLRHHGVIRLYDYDCAADLPWLVMNRVRGESLERVLHRCFQDQVPRQARSTVTTDVFTVPSHMFSFPPHALPCRGTRPEMGAGDMARLMCVFRKLCQVVRYLHARGVVHGDLKPGNVLVDRAVPVLIDFGHCRLPSDADVTLPSGGTVEYCSPEQAAGSPPSTGSDLYALGCIFYELLTGSCPFVGHRASVLAQHVSALPLAPSQLVRDVPEKVERALLTLLSKNPERRAAALKALLASLP